MNKELIRYLLTSSFILALFGNFIACGSQMYKVSVEHDVSPVVSSAEKMKERENPTSYLYGIHSSEGWSLPINYKFGEALTEDQKNQFKKAIQTWESALGKQIFSFVGNHEGITGDSFDDLYSSLSDNITGNYMSKDWKKTKKPEYVLATTIWNYANGREQISHADIRFNSQNYKIGDTEDLDFMPEGDREVVDMESLALHEVGHLLGLSHIDESVDRLSIMNPSLYIGEGMSSRKLSKGDIERIQKIYGCEADSCDIEEVYQKLTAAK